MKCYRPAGQVCSHPVICKATGCAAAERKDRNAAVQATAISEQAIDMAEALKLAAALRELFPHGWHTLDDEIVARALARFAQEGRA